MDNGLPSWLLAKYSVLMLECGYLPFDLDRAKAAIGNSPPAPLILYRLKTRGLAEGMTRGRYRLVHPLARLTELVGRPWRHLVRQTDRLPILEISVARLVEELGGELRSVLLFGSLARGSARTESDIDLLVVADGLPDEYSERVRLVNAVVSSKVADEWRRILWRTSATYPLVDTIALKPDEASVTHPFYLDMVESGITIVDRGAFMARKLESVRAKLAAAGATKVVTPGGDGYWILSRDAESVVEL